MMLGISALLLIGCGSGSKTYNTLEENVTVEEVYEVPSGTSIIVDSSSGTTITQDNQVITIDCSAGSCGDISIGVPQEESTPQPEA